MRFETRFSGALTVRRDGDLLAMDFPSLRALDLSESASRVDRGLGEDSRCGHAD